MNTDGHRSIQNRLAIIRVHLCSSVAKSSPFRDENYAFFFTVAFGFAAALFAVVAFAPFFEAAVLLAPFFAALVLAAVLFAAVFARVAVVVRETRSPVTAGDELPQP